MVRLEAQLVHPLAQIPRRTRDTDAGYDIFSVESVVLPPHSTTIVHTGIRLAAPPGFYYTIDGRSSLWSKGIVPNRGIIDATYCDNVVVSLNNFTDAHYEVKQGDRIAQLILHRQEHIFFDIVEKFSDDYNKRGMNGFGSSGR
jgi:dUTP pyrophosphatase